MRMTKIEKIFLEKVEAKKVFIFLAAVSFLGILLRLSGRHYVSGDARVYLIPWFEKIQKRGGLEALRSQIGNYNIPYQFLIALATYLPLNVLSLYKGISIVFDYFLAAVTGLFLCEIVKKPASKYPELFALTYGAVLFLPTVFLNSSVWGQCDSIYSSFVVLSLLFLLRKQYKVAFSFLGVAFAFKLQTIFILPFFCYHYVSEKKYSIFNFLFSLIWFYIPCIPGFLYGRGLMDPFTIYLEQSELYKRMWMNFPSFWAMAGGKYKVLGKAAIAFTIFCLGSGLFYVLVKKIELSSRGNFLKTAVWTLWTCLLFLPAMHERYGYLLEIMLVVLAFYDKEYLLFAMPVEVISLLTYGKYLFGLSINIQVLSACYFAAYLGYCWKILKKSDHKRKMQEVQNETDLSIGNSLL